MYFVLVYYCLWESLVPTVLTKRENKFFFVPLYCFPSIMNFAYTWSRKYVCMCPSLNSSPKKEKISDLKRNVSNKKYLFVKVWPINCQQSNRNFKQYWLSLQFTSRLLSCKHMLNSLNGISLLSSLYRLRTTAVTYLAFLSIYGMFKLLLHQSQFNNRST